MAVRVVRWSLGALAALSLAACASKRASPTLPSPTQSRAAPARATASTHAPKPEGGAEPLYSATEALRDVLSSPWQYVDTGPWPGSNRTQACVFRNARVLLVNKYCTLSEVHAYRIDVYSPEHGHVGIYAEANGPVSARARDDYFTFVVESEPPPSPEAQVPPLSLDMTFGELYQYEQKRYDAYLPSCYGGEQRSEPAHSCLGKLSPREDQWMRRHRDFLQAPGPLWYHVLRKTRALAQQYGAPLQ